MDYVILDTPPVLLAAGALILAKYVDGVLLSARLGATTRDEAQKTASQLERAGARIIGVVAQGAKSHGHYYRYRYRECGYERGYGYEYSSD